MYARVVIRSEQELSVFMDTICERVDAEAERIDVIDDSGTTHSRTAVFFEFFLYLFRACLGKMIVFVV